MTRFYLIRHATHGLPEGSLPGRTSGLFLPPEGEKQAEQLAARLASVRFDAIYSSPLERTQQTAAHIATRQTPPRSVQTSDALNEIDYGAWTGKTIIELTATDAAWPAYNTFRSGTSTPNGESILDIQARAVSEIIRLRRVHGDNATVALVSHGDVLRALLCHFLAMPLDLLLRLEIAPASVSIVDVNEWGPRVVCVNDTSHL